MEKNLQLLHPFLAPVRNLWILTQALQGMHLHFDLEICLRVLGVWSTRRPKYPLDTVNQPNKWLKSFPNEA